MAKKLYEESNIQGIADAIRYANGGSDTYTPSEMEAGVRALKKTLVSKNISENGDYSPASDDADGYSAVHVSVPSSAPAVLVSKNINQNGTYIALDDDSADGYSQVVVNVSGQGGGAAFLLVYYPSGNTCTATNGTDTLTSNTSGFYVFSLPEPQTYPETWTISTTISGTVVSEQAVIYGKGESHTVVLTDEPNTISFLKAEFAKTNYARLSNTIGDSVNFRRRGFTRTTNEPILFLNCHYRENSYYSYSFIAFGSNAPAGTNIDSYGGISSGLFTYDIFGIPVCSGFMNGWWNVDNPIYNVDPETNVTFSLGYDVPRINSNTHAIECDDPDELALFLARAFLLFSIVKEQTVAGTESLVVIKNGTYTPSSGKLGFDQVVVTVPDSKREALFNDFANVGYAYPSFQVGDRVYSRLNGASRTRSTNEMVIICLCHNRSGYVETGFVTKYNFPPDGTSAQSLTARYDLVLPSEKILHVYTIQNAGNSAAIQHSDGTIKELNDSSTILRENTSTQITVVQGTYANEFIDLLEKYADLSEMSEAFAVVHVTGDASTEYELSRGGESITFETDSNGEAYVMVPFAGTWAITVGGNSFSATVSEYAHTYNITITSA